jgi:plasmid stabilization system protein ParE
MREVKLSLAARNDFADAFEWYEAEQSGLGEAFRLAVEAQLSRVARDPSLYSPINARTRRAAVRRFPYVIVYAFDDARVIVHALLHTSRHPRHLRSRAAGN